MKLTTAQVVIICGLTALTLIVGILLNPSDDSAQSEGQKLTPSATALQIFNTKLPSPNKETITIKKLVLSEQRFEKRNYAKQDRNTKIQNSLNYLLFSPSKPWPEGLEFPLIIHVRDHNDTAFSAEYITQTQMAFNFPSFSVVPDIQNLFHDATEDSRHSASNISPASEHFRSKYQETAKSVNYKQMRQDASLITKPLTGLIEELRDQLPIDEKKIYIIGCGYGGAIVYHILENKPDIFAAAVTVNSSWQSDKLDKLTKTPILMQNGKKNTKFSSFVANNLANDINKAGGKVIFQGYESMPHTCSYKNLYSSNVWKWMFSQKNL